MQQKDIATRGHRFLQPSERPGWNCSNNTGQPGVVNNIQLQKRTTVRYIMPAQPGGETNRASVEFCSSQVQCGIRADHHSRFKCVNSRHIKLS